MSRLIGLAGPARVGKSTTADTLCREDGYVELAFADPLKESLIALTGLDRKYFYDQKFKHAYVELIQMSPRELMQIFGTEFVREKVRRDFWVARLRERILDAEYINKIVVSDIRFNDEAALIRELGGNVIILSRDSIDYDLDHASEAGITKTAGDILITLPEGLDKAEEAVIDILGGL